MSRASTRIIGTAVGITAVALATLGLASAQTSAPAGNLPQAISRHANLPPAKAAPAQVQLSMTTLHAAALSKARTASDSTDAPYLLVTVFGPGSMQTSMQMPSANKHWAIRQDEAKGAAPLTALVIAPGDSVRVLFTLLEAEQVNSAAETSVGTALAKLNAASMSAATAIEPTLSPLTTHGAHWIGSGTMLVTNEGGKTYWRALDCVSTCTVSNSPVKAAGDSELTASASNATAGVLELNGNAATYHLQVSAKRTM